jgi:hypothetical protein
VIKPRKEKLTAAELQELHAEKPLTGRIDLQIEIADTSEKIKQAKDLMQLLVMQMNSRSSPAAKGCALIEISEEVCVAGTDSNIPSAVYRR